MSSFPLSLDELQAFFASEWPRAVALVREGAVRSLDWDEENHLLLSEVQSARKREVYVQTIDLKRTRKGMSISGSCSCFMSYNCKHVAAALISLVHLLDRERAAQQQAPGSVQSTFTFQDEKLVGLIRFIWEQKKSLHEPYLGQIRELYQRSPVAVQAALGQALWAEVGGLIGEGQAASPVLPVVKLPVEHQVWLEQALEKERASSHTLLYGLEPVKNRQRRLTLKVRVFSAKRTKQGFKDIKPYTPGSSFAQYVLSDLPLVMALGQVQDWEGLKDHSLTGHILTGLLETGRVYLLDHWDTPVRLGEPREGTLGWRTGGDGLQHPRLKLDPEVFLVLPLSRPWYLDLETHELGPVQVAQPAQEVQRFLNIPPLKIEHSAAFARVLQERFGDRFPEPQTLPVQEAHAPLVPRLTFHSDSAYLGASSFGTRLHTVHLEWTYLGEAVTDVTSEVLQTVKDGVIYALRRDTPSEQATLKRLKKLGFDEADRVHKNRIPERLKKRWTFKASRQKQFSDEALWLGFLAEEVPALKKEGWDIRFDPGFDFRVAEVQDWYASLEEGGGWFGLELGVVVGEKRIPVLPLLTSLIRSVPAPVLASQMQALSDEDLLYPRLEDGTLLPLPVRRVRSILGTLVELYSQAGMHGAQVRVPLLDAARIAELEDEVQGVWSGGEKLRELGHKLRNFSGLKTVDLPAGLQATLRPYQHEGVNWLQFLREHGLSGILADDMGLGKTLQTLTHILIEKEQGRLERPVLIVAPTSLMHNWLSEAQKFTPELKVLVLQGKDRKADFERIQEHDVVLSTYPLISRDFEVLSRQHFHSIILDEAQNIKNARSATSKAIGLLKSDHRLCLTGTPLENHLGELWSLFHFLMPGFLGDSTQFGQMYRNPIEKNGDLQRRLGLAKRIRPFLLRRTKEQVAKELPEKTEMVVKLDLEGPQRDLYETLRVSVQKQLQDEIALKGLARSQIALLDALLKLRQVCCDPRLLSLSEARKVKSPVKLAWFTETLPSMIEEGRRVLVFSQFATLLGLLETALQDLKIPYSKLTGGTIDRKTQIERFQHGDTRVFLISLKAGGVGLNLTAADTVIHYDPWWNPAAENQATDRAYRIGQDKPVFVYKLITSGTIEEKILEMQSRKAALAQGVLEGSLGDGHKLSLEDVQQLFAPINA